VLSRFEHIESIPDDLEEWGISPGRAKRLAESLEGRREEALLYRQLATLRQDVPLEEKLDDLEWQGAHERLKELCADLGEEKIPERISRWR
jgi:5'-3' exonuclease